MGAGHSVKEGRATAASSVQGDFSYPPLTASSYAVASPSARERWWFADGAWVAQGQVGASVGTSWTHWLADRGVQGATFDREYALDLYRAARQEAGEDPEVDGGAPLGAAARVLQTRGLVAEAYACAGIDDVVGALLERGPLVAGLAWREAFQTPDQIDGWFVCRLPPEESAVLGGHAILLNGISLDLAIDGVQGFVRLKNSWGREWGDGGHVLISLKDLEVVLEADRALLPIPSASALAPGGRQDFALEDLDGYAPQVVGYERTAIGSDLWTTRDSVGASSYADAVARAIQHPETDPPLTIGIKAPWGAGKTSLMRMIRSRLEWPDGEGETGGPLRKLRLVGDDSALSEGGVTNRVVLKMIGDQRSADPSNLLATPRLDEDGATRREEDRWRPTVWFNPWMYQTGEQVWAGLAYELIDQVTSRMSAAERERFWLRLNLARVDQEAVRRKIYKLVLERAGGCPDRRGTSVTVLTG